MSMKEHVNLEDGNYCFDDGGEICDLLLKMRESREWLDVCTHVAQYSHMTSDECWNGMEDALRVFLEGVDA